MDNISISNNVRERNLRLPLCNKKQSINRIEDLLKSNQFDLSYLSARTMLPEITWLHTINLQYNALRSIPSALSRLPLQILHITTGNPIEELPDDFIQLSLKEHDLHEWFSPFKQSRLISRLDAEKYPVLANILKITPGLCEYICNQIILKNRDLLRNSKADLTQYITEATLSEKEIIQSYTQDLHSLFGIPLLQCSVLSQIYPDNLFSWRDQRKLLAQGILNEEILKKGLSSVVVGEIVKLCIIPGKYGQGGHTVLIEKMTNNKYIFFDPSRGTYRKLSFDRLTAHITVYINICYAADVYFTKGSDFANRVSYSPKRRVSCVTYTALLTALFVGQVSLQFVLTES